MTRGTELAKRPVSACVVRSSTQKVFRIRHLGACCPNGVFSGVGDDVTCRRRDDYTGQLSIASGVQRQGAIGSVEASSSGGAHSRSKRLRLGDRPDQAEARFGNCRKGREA